jgi:DNA-binding SARP family transcriptional activator
MISVHLFGRLSVASDGRAAGGFEAGKLKELLCYLLLHCERPQPREALAEQLWGEASAAHARKYLRQTLWQLQQALETVQPNSGPAFLLVEPDWIRFNSAADVWVDVRVFEAASAELSGLSGSVITDTQASTIEAAVRLYHGDLLEGCYHDWCLFERERLKLLYLGMLDKLVSFCEMQCRFEAGVAFAERILTCDRAHERTHRRLMRLHYLAGDRTAALRQYDRCAAAVAEELDVAPTHETVALRNQIRLDQLETSALLSRGVAAEGANLAPETDLLRLLRHSLSLLAELRGALEREVRALEKPPSSGVSGNS